MTEKLGELLLRRGLLTTEQLEQALGSQRTFGGALGTHLLQLGLVAAEDLAAALSAIYEVSSVSRESLLAAPPEIIALLSPEFIRRYRAVPFGIEGDCLHLAMVNPADTLAIHEAAFLTGFSVQPFVGLEAVLDEVIRLVFPPGDSDDDAAEQQSAPPAPEPHGLPLVEAAQSLAASRSRDEALEAALDALLAVLPRAAVFAVRGDSAFCFRQRGFSPSESGKPAIVSLLPPSVLSPAELEAGLRLAPLGDGPQREEMIRALGSDPGTAPVLSLSLSVRGKPVAVLYGETDPARLPEQDHLRRLAAMTSLALESVLLRAKILATARHRQ